MGAVAIELYLKSLSPVTFHTQDTILIDDCDLKNFSVVTAGPQKFGHKLTEIIDIIDSHIRNEIDLAFSSKRCSTNRTFRDLIEPLDDALEVSRYPFESGNDISKYDLADFELAVQCLHDLLVSWQNLKTKFGSFT